MTDLSRMVETLRRYLPDVPTDALRSMALDVLHTARVVP